MIRISPFDGPTDHGVVFPFRFLLLFSVSSFSFLFLLYVVFCFFLYLFPVFSAVFFGFQSIFVSLTLFLCLFVCFPLYLSPHVTVPCLSIIFPSPPLHQIPIANASLLTPQQKHGHWAAQKARDKCRMGIGTGMGSPAVFTPQEPFPSAFLSCPP